MDSILISNLVSFIAEIANTILPFLRTKRKMLLLQVVIQVLFIVAYASVKSYTLIALCILVALRNIYAAYVKPSILINIIFLIVGTAISYIVNTNGVPGILPIICYVTYTIAIISTNNEQTIRYILLINTFLYAIFDFSIMMYVCAVFDIIHVVTTVLAIKNYNKVKITLKKK